MNILLEENHVIKKIAASLMLIGLLAACGEKAPAPAPAAPAEPAPAAAPAPTAAAAPAAPAAPSADSPLAQGEATFKKACAFCHKTGEAGAPKLGSKEDWDARVAKGKETLYGHAINGFTGQKGTMPPKGGNAALSDDEVKAVVDYMTAQVM